MRNGNGKPSQSGSELGVNRVKTRERTPEVLLQLFNTVILIMLLGGDNKTGQGDKKRASRSLAAAMIMHNVLRSIEEVQLDVEKSLGILRSVRMKLIRVELLLL
jgi:hypothetical protein